MRERETREKSERKREREIKWEKERGETLFIGKRGGQGIKCEVMASAKFKERFRKTCQCEVGDSCQGANRSRCESQ